MTALLFQDVADKGTESMDVITQRLVLRGKVNFATVQRRYSFHVLALSAKSERCTFTTQKR